MKIINLDSSLSNSVNRRLDRLSKPVNNDTFSVNKINIMKLLLL